MIACGGSCRKRAVGEVVVSASASDRTAIRRIGCGCDGVAVQFEVGHIAGSACYLEGIAGIGRDLGAVLRPLDEVVTCSRSCRQRAVGKVVVGSSTGNRAACCRVRSGSDSVAVQFEVGHVAGSACYLEGITGIGRDLRTVLRPLDEVIACGGSCRQRAVLEVVVGTSASDHTTISRIGGGCNLVAVQLEVGDIACCLCHLEGIGRIGGHLNAVLRPSEEGIARSSGGRQRAVGEVVKGSSTSDRTAFSRIGCCRDRVTINLEVSHIVCFLRNREGINRVGRDLGAVLRPLHKVEAFGGNSRQVAGLSISEGTHAVHRTTVGRVHRHHRRDVIAVDFEVCHIGIFPSHYEAVVGISRDLGAVFGPVHKVVACGRYGRQVTGLSIIVGARAVHRTTVGRIHRHHRRDIITVKLEVCHIAGRFGDGDAIACTGAHLGAVFGPVLEGVASNGFGYHSNLSVMLEGAACEDRIGYMNGTANGRVGCG